MSEEQSDTYTWLLTPQDAAASYLFNKHGTPLGYDAWGDLRRLVDWVSENWGREDEGIWEVRGGRRHFVFSRLMCWVALDRGLRLAEKRSFPADRARWLGVRDGFEEGQGLRSLEGGTVPGPGQGGRLLDQKDRGLRPALGGELVAQAQERHHRPRTDRSGHPAAHPAEDGRIGAVRRRGQGPQAALE